MSAPRPYPGDLVPDAVDEPFWRACRQRRLLVHRCGECGRALWPAGSCPRHGMEPMEWVPAGGGATLHSWTVVHQRYGNSFADPPPNVAVVELDEGALLHSTVLDAEELVIGMRLRVDFSEIGEDVVVPVFRPDPPPAHGSPGAGGS